MSAALLAAQWRHDMAEPASETKFIDTAEGDAWAKAVADDLMACKPLIIGGREVLGAFALADKLGELTAFAPDSDNNYNAMILYAALGQGDKSRACFEAFMGRKFVEELAYKMAAEHAEAYAATLSEVDYE